MDSTTMGFIGAGNMANSLIRGLIAKNSPADSIWASDLDTAKLDSLQAECGIRVGSNAEIAAQAEVIVLAVKPQVMPQVCQALAKELADRSVLLISIAAGITTAHLQSWFGKNAAIVRCMPNTPALVGMGATGLFATSQVSSQQKLLAEDVLSAVGFVAWVAKETDIDSVTAVSGSGPAYFFLFMEAMQDTAKKMGLSDKLARELTYHTAAGAAALAQHSTEDIATLRRNVTSPGGTTEQAIQQFENDDLRELVDKALQAARKRSVELAAETDNT